jgi:hypothetical protein
MFEDEKTGRRIDQLDEDLLSPAAWDSSTAWRFTASMPRRMTDEGAHLGQQVLVGAPRIVEVIR